MEMGNNIWKMNLFITQISLKESFLYQLKYMAKQEQCLKILKF